MIGDIAQILGIQIKCVTTKHPQTIGKLERTHASLKTNRKIASGDYRRLCHKYHAILDCEPSRIFQSRVIFNLLDHNSGPNPNPKIFPTTDLADEFQR